MERLQSKSSRKEGGGLYFKAKPTNLKFIRSGSTLLDCVNGGGWPLGRMTNLIGDKSTGKTLLAIEAFANFTAQYKGKLFYRESEAAFEKSYAESIGMPVDQIDFGPKGKRWKLIEEVYDDLKEKAAICKERKVPGIYVVDSLDALSTKIDMAREFGEQTYRTDKPSQLGELFRKMTADVEDAQMALIVISQTRAKIGATFGEKTTRSGGAALDFYATTINKLAHLQQISKTRNGQKRVVAVKIKAKNTKSKVIEPFRDCEFTIRFGYGINDAASCLEWLIDVNRTKEVDPTLTKEKAKGTEKKKGLLGYLHDLDKEALEEWSPEIVKATKKVWEEVEEGFRPKVKKYG